VTPDIIFKDASLLLTKILGYHTTKAYHSKIDFKKQLFISMEQEASLSIIEC